MEGDIIKIIIWGVMLLILVIFLTIMSFITFVPAGHKGVVTNWGAVTEKTFNEGINFKTPLVEDVIIMNVRTRLWKETSSAGTSDLQTVNTETALNYHLDPRYVNNIYQTIGTDIENVIISPSVDEVVKSTTAQFTAEQLTTQRDEVKQIITLELEVRLGEFHIIVDELSMTEFTFSREYDAAIEQKQVAQQRALQAEQELRQIEIEAQQQVVQATAQAQAILSVARAQSEANALTTVSLTDEILRQQWISKWNGVLPAYMLGEDANILIQR